MRQPTERRRPRATVRQPPCSTSPPPLLPTPPPHPSILLRWDAVGCRETPGYPSSIFQMVPPCTVKGDLQLEGYPIGSALVPSNNHSRDLKSPRRTGSASTFTNANQRHQMDSSTNVPHPSGSDSLWSTPSIVGETATREASPPPHSSFCSPTLRIPDPLLRYVPICSNDCCHRRLDKRPSDGNLAVPSASEDKSTNFYGYTNKIKDSGRTLTSRSDDAGEAFLRNIHSNDSRVKSPATSSGVRRGQHRWIAGVLIFLFAASSSWRQCTALCPPRCQCDDLTLSATCSDAALEVIPIQLNPEVESISLHGNRISAVDQSLGFYARLRHLDLSSNRLRSLGERNFQLQGSLTSLNVSGNHIGAVSRHAFAGIGLSESLMVLDLARNRLGTFPLAAIAGLKSLRELHVGHNQLTSIGDGDSGGEIHLQSLELLDLTGNRLQEVPTLFLKHTPGLRVLIIARNEISGLPDGSLPSPGLFTLSFAGNLNLGSSGIDDAAFSSTSASLSYLDLSDSGLTSVPTKALSVLAPALTDLDLSGNPIGELLEGSFSPLRSLRRVQLSRLPLLSVVHAAAFAGPPLPTSSSSPQAVTAMCPPQLEHISMEWNPGLQRLPDGLLSSCTRLTTLALRGAALEGLDATVLPAPPVRLRSLSLAGNPLRCNCSLMWLSALANATVGSQPFLDGARCAEPPRLAGRLLSRLPEAELRCEPSWETVLAIAMASVTFILLVAFAILFGRRCARHHKCCGSLETPTPTPTAPPPPPPRRHFPQFNPSSHQNGVPHRKDMEFGVWGGKGPLGGGRDDSIAANEYTDLIGVGVGRMVIPAGYRGPTGVYV